MSGRRTARAGGGNDESGISPCTAAAGSSRSLVAAVTELLVAAGESGRPVTFLHVPKCFGTSFSLLVSRVFPGVRFSGGHCFLEAARRPAGTLLVSSVRDPAARLKSVVLHALRDNRPGGFCPPARFPVLTAFLQRPTAAGLREYLSREYHRASILRCLRSLVDAAIANPLLDRVAANVDTPSTVDLRQIESYADAVMDALAVCLYDDPEFMNWLPLENSAGAQATQRHRPAMRFVAEVCEQVVAQRPGVLQCEQAFYDRCVERQRNRLVGPPTAILRRAA